MCDDMWRSYFKYVEDCKIRFQLKMYARGLKPILMRKL